jgi:methylase of polypeptide subunit release factors
MNISAIRYLNLAAAPEHLQDILEIEVTEHSFLPSVDEILSDWVATIATPAFKLIRSREGAQEAFCSIGTGVGLDALAAIETLGATRIGITDVHEDVVAAAAANIRRNLREPERITLEAGFGDLLQPLSSTHPRYDLIYENLPNIPIRDTASLATARMSSGHVPPRSEAIPELMRRNLLALHYVALLEARSFLRPGGSVLSLIGGRIPLAVLQEMAKLAGYHSEICIYGWKIQTDPEAMIAGHLAQTREGFGPYHFYRASRLAEVFSDVALEDSSRRAHDIEADLAPEALDSEQALLAHRRGEVIGHTVVALRSYPGTDALTHVASAGEAEHRPSSRPNRS